jgi:hypothetical protein
VAAGVYIDQTSIMGNYQTLRSVSDHHLFVVCHDGEFYSLPEDVRKRGPWQGMQRGEISDLKPEHRLDLQVQATT